MRLRWASLRRARLIAVSCAACCVWSGCTTAPPRPERDASAALIAHREFEAAAKAAPQWVSDALHIITDYERQLALAKNGR